MKLFLLKILPLLLLGLLVGFVNGLLGAGGGILIIYGLNKLLGDKLQDKRSVYATAIAVILPFSAISAFRYFRAGSLDLSMLSKLIVPAILGGACGALLLRRLSPAALSRLFAAVVLVSGIVLVM